MSLLRPRARRRRTSGAWVHIAFLVLLVIGGAAAHNASAGDARREDCAPLVWHQGMDPAGWQLLREQGYRDHPDDGMSALYPPGCEGVTP